MGHLQEKGFSVETIPANTPRLNAVKDQLGVPSTLRSCHTGIVGDYVVEGHVPASIILRLLQEAPDVVGIAVPGMPPGSPGMEGPNPQPYKVYTYDREGGIQIYAEIKP